MTAITTLYCNTIQPVKVRVYRISPKTQTDMPVAATWATSVPFEWPTRTEYMWRLTATVANG